MKSLHSYINERFSTNKDNILYLYHPESRGELIDAILYYLNNGDGNLNDIDVSKLKEKDFYCLFRDLNDEIKKNNITEINISKWKLKELYYDDNSIKGMFEDCETLESIILPDFLEVVGKYTFYKCTKLDNITIPNLVTTINWGAFNRCNNLSSVTIPNSVQSINKHAFDGCSCLTNITIPKSITFIGYDAFFGCSNLIITVPNEQVKKLVVDCGFNGKIIIK